MLQDGVGYTLNNSSGGQSLVIDTAARQKETLPFFVYEDTDSAGQGVLRINPGTFNNELPTVGGATIGEQSATLPLPLATSIVALRIPASESFFPAAQPTVEWFTGTFVPENEEDVAYVALALVNVSTEPGSSEKIYKISSLASGSIWGERFQCGEELEYWFSRI